MSSGYLTAQISEDTDGVSNNIAVKTDSCCSRMYSRTADISQQLNPLIATLKPQSNGPSYSNTMTVHWPLMGGVLQLIQRGGD